MAVSGNYILFYLSNKMYRTKNVPCAGTVTRATVSPVTPQTGPSHWHLGGVDPQAGTQRVQCTGWFDA